MTLASVILSSCCGSPAGGVECVNDDELNFSILSTTGQDLFTGTNQKYKIDELKLYTIYENTRYDVGYVSNGSEGKLMTTLDYKFETLIIEIGGQPKDTINFKLNVSDDRCCGMQTRIDIVNIDGVMTKYDHYHGIEIKIVD
jgi:hypothetical protein